MSQELDKAKELATYAVEWLTRPKDPTRAPAYAAVAQAIAAVISAEADERQAAALERIASRFDALSTQELGAILKTAAPPMGSDVERFRRGDPRPAIACWKCNRLRYDDMSSCSTCNAPPADIPF